jgi:two-component system NtrC family sensor kinase
MTSTRLSSRIDLRGALVLYVVVPLSIALGVASYHRLQSLEDWIEKLLQEDVELIARTLQHPLSGALQRYDRQALGEALKTVYQLNREFGIYIYDDTGRTLTAGNEIVPEPLSQNVLRSVLSGKRKGEYGDLAGSDVYSYFVPLTEENTAIGVLQVTRLVSDFHDYFTRVRLQTLLWWMAAVAIMTALVLSGHHLAIGKPLGRLVSSIAAVTAGDRRHRAPTQGPSEIMDLGIALNRMLDSIDSAEQEIERRHRIQTELERRLRHSESMAALGRLAAGVAHELGTPLSIVDGKAQRLLRRDDCSPAVMESLGEIRQEVRRMEQIVRQLLDFGRNQGDQRRMMAADQLAAMALVTVQERFAESGTVLMISGAKPAPTLLVNPMRVEQALVNLLRNACQANSGGHVKLSWFATLDGVSFRVEDSGPGIPAAVRQKIFEPFYSTKAVGQGSGLGLAIVESVAREHGGTIEVCDSSLGGAGFLLRLPQSTQYSDEKTESSDNDG